MKKKILIGIIIGAAALQSCSPKTNTSTSDKESDNVSIKNNNMTLKTELDSVSYGLGVNIAQNLSQQGINELNTEALAAGIEDVLNNSDLQISPQDAGTIINEYMQKKQQSKFESNIKAGEEFLEKNGKRSEVVTLESGLQYEILKEGNGPKPSPTDKVTTHYHGTLISGEVFDSSVERGQPASFPVNGVIKGWQEALVLMPVGSKWRLYVPSDLAYGANGAGPKIGPYSTLIFDVELLKIGE